MRKILLLTSFLMAGCASAQHKESKEGTLKPSELNSKAAEYDGKEVTIRGYVVLGFEKRYLVDDKKSYEKWPNNNVCVTLVNAEQLLAKESEYNEKQVELKGTFRRDVLTGVIRLGACNASGLEIDPTQTPRVL